MNGLKVRVVDATTGAVLVEQDVTTDDDIIGAATFAADQSAAHMRTGQGIRLEVMDPDGDLFPAGEWVPVVHGAVIA